QGSFDAWTPLGGRETLLSYGLSPQDLGALAPGELYAVLAAAVPAEHTAFLAALPLWYTAGPYIFAHAGIRPHVALADQTPADLMWIR
ncbi:serine/threonine protein phosphatase, partial [Mycobacterium tuberculosis]|nr:serine/threonine protein phosphatase [Mycobacterium tuberculosis]